MITYETNKRRNIYHNETNTPHQGKSWGSLKADALEVCTVCR